MAYTFQAVEALQGALQRVYSQAHAQAFPSYAPDAFHDGISRLDTTHFFQSSNYPDLLLIENWRPTSKPYGYDAFQSEQGKNVFAPEGPLFTHPRFFLTTDRRHYALFDERRYQIRSWTHYRDRLTVPGTLLPHDDQLKAGDHRKVFGHFDLVRETLGTFCLTPNETDDSRKIFLTLHKDGKEAILQMGNDPRYAIKLNLSISFPLHHNFFALPSTHKGTLNELKPHDFLSPAVFNRFFNGASLYVAGQSTQPAFLAANGKTLDDIMADLNRLIGLDPIKKQIRAFADTQRFVELRRSRGFQEKKKPKLHAAFIGNPGTGKTTVAQMLGGMYRELGLLSKGHVHKVTRDDLVAKYIGQTAPKVKDAIEAARGGVLFIDEAYGLARSGQDGKDFGREVIEMLLQEMSDGPGDIAIVFAGYPEEMRSFINSNPGLESRISFYDFPDYTSRELMDIADVIADDREVKISESAHLELAKSLEANLKKKTPNFGNARFIERIMDRAKEKLAARVMNSMAQGINPNQDDLELIESVDMIAALNDMPHLKENKTQKKQVGFVKEGE